MEPDTAKHCAHVAGGNGGGYFHVHLAITRHARAQDDAKAIAID